MRHSISIILLMFSAIVCAQNIDLQKLCAPIDEAIPKSAEYVAQREARITTERHNLGNATEIQQKYDNCYRLYELYRPFVSDSAIFFLRKCVVYSRQLEDASATLKCQSLLSLRCSNIGMYDEALALLDSIQVDSGVDSLSLGTYYEAYNNVYSELSYYTRLPEMKNQYLAKAKHYEQLMQDYLPPTSDVCLMRRELAALNAGKLEESMKVNDEWRASVEVGSHPYAFMALYRYLEFKARRDTTEMMHWLVESVLADIQNAVMDQGSMWELANELMLRGDIDRASRYISYTSDCANRYGSRQRNWQIAPLLSSIAKSYKTQSERTTSQLRLTVVVISVLALLLLGALFFVHRRNKQLATARNALKASNDELAGVNAQLAQQKDELSELNSRLSSLNLQLSAVNSQLSESNRVKEEYIGRFMSLCSQYIDKLDDYRKMVHKKLKNKEIDELYQTSKSTQLKEKELEELYENFDMVFLHLFPSFIDDFNSLLQPEMQIHPKQENRLNTDIRIFALIRLGFEDSSKIAEFLHYSVNTIYNYRARIKNGAVGNREQFEQNVKELGMIKGEIN